MWVVWKQEWQLRPGRQQRTVVFSGQFAAERQDEAQRYVTAYLEGLREYYDSFEHGVNRDVIIDVLAQECGDSREVVADSAPAGVDPNGRLSVKCIEDELHWYQEGGFLPWRISVEQTIDEKYIEQAVQELGPYSIPSRR